jgi:hypothetical protein
MNVLLLTSHSIAEHDDLDMFTRMGVQVYSIGAYSDPQPPTDDKRPPLPNARHWSGLRALTDERREELAGRYGDPGPKIDWAKARLAQGVIDWADTIIVHHFPEQWIGGQWQAIREKRVIWRTCGQSNPIVEHHMSQFRKDGLQIVRYSPREREAFPRLGAFAGEDVMIRFGKDPDEWTGWTGAGKWVGNITQHMKQRGDACGYFFWEEATRGLNAIPAGPGSEAINGLGALTYEQMRGYLRDTRAYLYTGTSPASYTLGLIEAMMTGTPVIPMGAMQFNPPELYEADDIAECSVDNPIDMAAQLKALLKDEGLARRLSERQRHRAIELFDLRKVSRQWAEFLGLPVPYEGWLAEPEFAR